MGGAGLSDCGGDVCARRVETDLDRAHGSVGVAEHRLGGDGPEIVLAEHVMLRDVKSGDPATHAAPVDVDLRHAAVTDPQLPPLCPHPARPALAGSVAAAQLRVT